MGQHSEGIVELFLSFQIFDDYYSLKHNLVSKRSSKSNTLYHKRLQDDERVIYFIHSFQDGKAALSVAFCLHFSLLKIFS